MSHNNGNHALHTPGRSLQTTTGRKPVEAMFIACYKNGDNAPELQAVDFDGGTFEVVAEFGGPVTEANVNSIISTQASVIAAYFHTVFERVGEVTGHTLAVEMRHPEEGAIAWKVDGETVRRWKHSELTDDEFNQRINDTLRTYDL